MNQHDGSKAPEKTVSIGNRPVGDSQPCYVIAEIGINHNGNIDLAKRLISVAVAAGCDAVKFQKRTVEVVYSPEELAKARESPFGATNGTLGWSTSAIWAHCLNTGAAIRPPWA